MLMIFGYRMEAIAILGREVMLPRGLVGLGFDSIDYCGPEIAEVSRTGAQSPNINLINNRHSEHTPLNPTIQS